MAKDGFVDALQNMNDQALYHIGLQFRQSVLDGKLAAEQYGAILLDLCHDRDDLKPALLDISKRRSFKELPLTGTPAQMILARDGLVGELEALYLPEIVAEMMDLIEGILGFVELPPEQLLAQKDVEDFDEVCFLGATDEVLSSSASSPDEIDEYNFPSETYRRTVRRYIGREDDEYLYGYPEQIAKVRRNELSPLGQICRTLLYQLPPFSLFLLARIFWGTQADLASLAQTLHASDLVLEYVNSLPWALVSFASITFSAAALQSGRSERALYRLEPALVAYYILVFAISASSVDSISSYALEMIGFLALSSLVARILMILMAIIRQRA